MQSSGSEQPNAELYLTGKDMDEREHPSSPFLDALASLRSILRLTDLTFHITKITSEFMPNAKSQK